MSAKIKTTTSIQCKLLYVTFLRSVYNWTSHTRPPKMSGLCAHLQEVDAYTLGQNFVSLAYGKFRVLPHFKCPIHERGLFWANKKQYFPLRKFLSFLLSRNVMFQHLITQSPHYDLSSGHLLKVKNKRKFQTSALKVVMVAYKRWSLSFQIKWFGIWENCSLRRGGCNWRFSCVILQCFNVIAVLTRIKRLDC